MSNPRNILLVHLFSNGDCLYATTVARQIKNDFPGCKLTWMIAAYCRNIIDNNPYVDEIITETTVAKNDNFHYRKLLAVIKKQQQDGQWDEVFITHNMYNNLCWYDGTVRGMVLRAYPRPITVPVQPVLVLTEEEKNKVARFASDHFLEKYKQVILWEYAPQSGQSALSANEVMQIAVRLTETNQDIAVILSSAVSFISTDNIIDASSLSVRENAALTHYCHLLIGCSSGLTWLTTSSAANMLPMLQLLNPQAMFINAPSEDFKRNNIPVQLIEMTTLDSNRIINCVTVILNEGMEKACQEFNEVLPLQFITTRQIVYNMLCYLQFDEIKKHYQVMTAVYGKHPLFLKAFYGAMAGFPVKLLRNIIRKKILKR